MSDFRIYPTLYKRTTTGAVQLWWMERDGGSYRSNAGKKDGAITTSEWTVTKPKNVGRSNETTADEQAHSSIESKYTKQQKKGRYFLSEDDIDNETYHVPMKAKVYADRWTGSTMFDHDRRYFSQPKLDGIRCIIKADGMWTSSGEPITSMGHIWDSVSFIFAEYPELRLDGELYNHKYHDKLNRINGLVSKKTLVDSEDILLALEIQFHMYDVTGNADFTGAELTPDTIYEHRIASRMYAYNRVSQYHQNLHQPTPSCIQYVMDTELFSQAELDDVYDRYIKASYEGQMIRFSDWAYEHRYSMGMLKRKEFIDREFFIHDVIEGEGNLSGMAGSVLYKTDDGKIFSSGVMGGHEVQRDIWLNRERYIDGRGSGTVQYFKYTEYGIPYLPKTVVVYVGERTV